ncbi:MAG: hypothetical protein PUE08_07620 [Eubacteriales bacterium]|nr:hypothetical protein [Eubacteriales bacterium]
MKNKTIAVIVILFVTAFIFIAAILGIAGHIPLLSKPLTFIIAIILVIFVTGFFAILTFRRLK